MGVNVNGKETAFSVLMSVYYKENADYFDLALKSILVDQSVTPTEFVLVCDGPLSEELDAVIEKYLEAHPQVFHVYRIKENQGLGKALNFGLKYCTNELIARADSDDVCAKNRFEEQLRYMHEHLEVSIVSSYIDEFDTDWTHPNKVKVLPLSHEEIVEMAKFRNPINHMAVMFRRRDIVGIGSYRHVPYVEDYELWVRAIVKGKRLGNIDKVLVHARVGNGMVGRRGNKAYIKSWKTLSTYMLENKMITRIQYIKNMVAIRAFVYIPSGIKEKIYKNYLRK